MASLSLRAYIQKIENLIDRGETEEAIAHCKHILKKFPKHVDTYRLLGKSYLEMQRYQEASDVLQRVLSVVPDDFVSQIGMSIIREGSENLDEAIWHMERAFEIQPSNNAVQDELKRLYSRRDGVIPQKILLTRGALVRMYVRGEAYPQAIAEGIAALKEDPQRADIQLLLAKSYLRTNQINEGYRICQKILESLPFSYEANQLIAEIHILTKQSDQAEPYLEHVRMLDPYAAFVNENAPTSAKVDENAIIIDELDYDEMTMSLESADSAEKSMYIEDDFDTSSLEIPTAGDSQPIEIDEDFSWMQEMMDEPQAEKPPEKQPSQKVPAKEEEIAFPFDSSSDFEEAKLNAAVTDEASADDDAFAALFAEMNDASDQSASEKETPSMQAQDDQEPMTMAEFFESTSSDEDETSPETDDSLDDFAALFDEQLSSSEQSSDSDDSVFKAALEEEQQQPAAEAPSQGEAIDDNVAAFFDEQSSGAEEQSQSVESIQNINDAEKATDDLPDWLKELDQESKDSDIEDDLQKEIDSLFTNGDLPTSTTEPEEETLSESKLDDEEDFTAKFLEELENEPQHPGKTRMFSMTADLSSGDSGPLPPLAEDTAPAKKATDEEVPDWLKQLEEQTDEFSDAEEVSTISEEQEQSPVSSIDSMSEEEEDLLREQYKAAQQTTTTTQTLSEEEDDDGFAWLESLAAKQSEGEDSSPQAVSMDASISDDDAPMAEVEKPTASTSIDSMSEEEEDRLREQFISNDQMSKATPILSEEEEDSFAWLESLAAKQGAGDDADQVEQPEQPAQESDETVITEAPAPEPVQQKSATSIDSMTEEEEERLREQFKSSQQTGQASQMDADDDDDSFAWLESLAAKQGVSEDTLLTSDEERDAESPQWLQETTVLEEIEPPISTPEHTAILPELDEVDGTSEEEPVTISKLEQAKILEESERQSKIEEPVWVDEFTASEQEIAKETQLPSSDSVEEEKKEEEVSVPDQQIEETPEQKIIETPQTPDDIPDWLKDLEDQTSIYAITDKDDVGQNIVDLEDVEIPGWITDVNETQQVDLDDREEETGTDIPEVHAEFISGEDEEVEQSEEAFTAIGLDINKLEKQLEDEQIIEHIEGGKQPELVEESLTQDTVEDEELSPEKIPAPVEEVVIQIKEEEPAIPEEDIVFDIPSDFVDEILQETEPTGPLPLANEDDTELLTEMVNLFSENNIADALTKADHLIEKEVYLENIIEELTKAIVDHPIDPSIFVRLGDAYIRNNEIQKALDMYQEAENLLQK